MNGINILNQKEIMEYSNAQNVIGMIALALIFISIIIIVVGYGIYIDGLIMSGFVLLLVSMFTLAIVANRGKIHHTGQYKYEATIDDNVPFIEVYKKYDVVKQKGDLWVLKDKEVEE